MRCTTYFTVKTSDQTVLYELRAAVPPRAPDWPRTWSAQAEQERDARPGRSGELALRALAQVEEEEDHGDTCDQRERQEQSAQCQLAGSPGACVALLLGLR